MTTIDTASDDVGSEETGRFLDDHPSLILLGRVGWVAKGVVYGLTGALAVAVVSQPSGSQEASQGGAIARIAREPFGEALLWLMAAGLLVYVAWRVVSVLLPADNDAVTWATRAGYGVSALTYTALAFTAVSFARRPGSAGTDQQSSEDAQIERLTRQAMEWTGGRWLIGLIGLSVIAVGGVFLWKAVSADFEKQLEPGSVGPLSHHVLVRLGQIGWIGRAAMMTLIGFFVTRAAVRFDPDDAQGLDGSLREAADAPLGTLLVGVVAVGLVVYGVFCLLTVPKRRLVAADR